MSEKLKILCVGTGRDGTVSISHMFREMFDKEGRGRTVMHEYASRDFLHCFADFMDTGEERYREQARILIRECPYDCIVGNGYASWLPLFAEICGPDLKLVHVRRLDRERCVDSLAENAAMFPIAYGSYSDDHLATSRRLTAFHYNETSREDWFALPTRARLAWYYDKTHALIDAYQALFPVHYELNTERLDGEDSRALIAEVAGVAFAPSAKHLNSHIFAEAAPSEKRSRMQWLFGQLDLKRAAEDDAYPLEYFMNAFISWTGYQIRRGPEIEMEDYPSPEALRELLARALMRVDGARGLIAALQEEVEQLYPPPESEP